MKPLRVARRQRTSRQPQVAGVADATSNTDDRIGAPRLLGRGSSVHGGVSWQPPLPPPLACRSTGEADVDEMSIRGLLPEASGRVRTCTRRCLLALFVTQLQ